MPQLYQYCILHWIHIRRWRIACISRHRHAVVIKRRLVKDTNHNSRMMLWLLVHSCCPWSVDGWRANIAIGAPWWRRCNVVREESVRRPWFVVGWWLIAARSLLCFWYAMKASRPADAWKTSYAVAGDLGSPWWCNGGHNIVRRVGGGHHDDDVTFRRRAEGVVRKYTRIYWTWR